MEAHRARLPCVKHVLTCTVRSCLHPLLTPRAPAHQKVPREDLRSKDIPRHHTRCTRHRRAAGALPAEGGRGGLRPPVGARLRGGHPPRLLTAARPPTLSQPSPERMIFLVHRAVRTLGLETGGEAGAGATGFVACARTAVKAADVPRRVDPNTQHAAWCIHANVYALPACTVCRAPRRVCTEFIKLPANHST